MGESIIRLRSLVSMYKKLLVETRKDNERLRTKNHALSTEIDELRRKYYAARREAQRNATISPA